MIKSIYRVQGTIKAEKSSPFASWKNWIVTMHWQVCRGKPTFGISLTTAQVGTLSPHDAMEWRVVVGRPHSWTVSLSQLVARRESDVPKLGAHGSTLELSKTKWKLAERLELKARTHKIDLNFQQRKIVQKKSIIKVSQKLSAYLFRKQIRREY